MMRELKVEQLLKKPSLFAPVDSADYGPQISFVESHDRRQKQELFLNVRSQIEQLHDLCHASARHPAEASEFRTVPNCLVPEQPVKTDGKRHEPRDPGSGADSLVASWRLRSNPVLPPARFAGTEINCVCDLLVVVHGRFSRAVVIAAGWNRMDICRETPS
jgi:hypothetical protein